MKCFLMKAMRGRIALPKHFVRNSPRAPFLFREAFGVRVRPPIAFSEPTNYAS
jgi:hypothetical protein